MTHHMSSGSNNCQRSAGEGAIDPTAWTGNPVAWVIDARAVGREGTMLTGVNDCALAGGQVPTLVLPAILKLPCNLVPVLPITRLVVDLSVQG